MRKFLASILCITLIGQAYAGFLPDEPQAPAAPNLQQTESSAPASPGVSTAVAQAWLISIPSSPTAAPGQVEILRKGGLSAYTQSQNNQTVVLVGPELNKSHLLQEQKIVLELLNTPGTIIPYTVSS